LVFPGAKAMNVATKICIFAAVVASYDLLLGYTARCRSRTRCFTASAAIRLRSRFIRWDRAGGGRDRIVIGLPLALLLALAIGLFSLRVEAIFLP